MTDYELYCILEANGYDTTNGNLAILKEGLESGEIILTEAKKSKKDKISDFEKNSEDYASDGKTKSARLGRIVKGVGKATLGAAVGAGLGGTAGAIAGNAMDANAVKTATSELETATANQTAAHAKYDDAVAELNDVKTIKPQSMSSDKNGINIDKIDKTGITADVAKRNIETDKKPNKLEIDQTDKTPSGGEKTAEPEEAAVQDQKYDSVEKAASDRVSKAKAEKEAADDAAASAAKAKEEAAGDHSRRKLGTIAGVAGGGVTGAYVGGKLHLNKYKKELSDEDDYRAYRRAKKRLGQRGITVDLKESSDEELRNLLEINGFESDDDNIATLRESGALILSTENIILAEGMAPEYALMKLLDANGFEPTAENVRILNAGLESGSILLN